MGLSRQAYREYYCAAMARGDGAEEARERAERALGEEEARFGTADATAEQLHAELAQVKAERDEQARLAQLRGEEVRGLMGDLRAYDRGVREVMQALCPDEAEELLELDEASELLEAVTARVVALKEARDRAEGELEQKATKGVVRSLNESTRLLEHVHRDVEYLARALKERGVL